MPFLLVLLGFLALPLIEIGVFIAVGSEIGVLPTLALIVLATVIGIFVVRRQSLSTFRAAQAEARAGRVPDRQLVHGAALVLAGFLLILPGFLTDALALLLLIPPVRDLLWRRAMRHVVVVRPGASFRGGRPAYPPDVVDLDEGEFRRAGDPSSPWRDAVTDESVRGHEDPPAGPRRG